MGSMHDGTEKDCINEALKQLVLCAEAAQNTPNCAERFALLRTDNDDTVNEQDNEATNDGTRMDETEDEAEELGGLDGDITPTRNRQLTPEEDSDQDEHIAPRSTQSTTRDDSRPLTSPNHFERVITSFTQADAAAALLSMTKSQ